MNNAFGVLLFLTALVASVWYSLKFCDWVRAVRYERKKAAQRQINQAFAEGYGAAMSEKSDVAQMRHASIYIVAPDRIRREIDALTGKAEATRYPRGS